MSSRYFLLIPNIRIHNANAMSSPYTIGFPAMTAWLGAMHALERHLHALPNTDLNQVMLKRIAVSCHQLNLQTYKGRGDYVHSIVGALNPRRKDGKSASFIEEARCHLDISLLIEFEGLGTGLDRELSATVNQLIQTMKIASGDVLSAQPAEILNINEDDFGETDRVLRKLMLGHVLVERRDLMIKAMQEGKDALEAMLDYLKIMHRSTYEPADNKDVQEVVWKGTRKKEGWIVPIAVGFQGISELDKAANQRDADTPHRFAESVLTLGEFIMPYRADKLDEILWQYHFDPDNNLYVCQTQAAPAYLD